jgi:hypothetical protein
MIAIVSSRTAYATTTRLRKPIVPSPSRRSSLEVPRSEESLAVRLLQSDLDHIFLSGVRSFGTEEESYQQLLVNESFRAVRNRSFANSMSVSGHQ